MAIHVETGLMRSPTPYQSKALAHLGLVAGMYDELGIGEKIDALIPHDETKRHISLGQAVKAMVLNGLGFANRALYLMPHFFEDKPTARLIGSGVTADHLNDDVLGRTLDAIYQYGATPLYMALAGQAVSRLDLACRCVHLDSTSFHTDGVYNSLLDKEDVPFNTIHVTKGYSRDHRPDLNQIVLQLINENQAGIPLTMSTLSGHADDKTHFRKTVTEYVSQLQNDVGVEIFVADSALYNKESLHEMELIPDLYWLTRVPMSIHDATQFVDTIGPELLAESTEDVVYRTLSTTYAGIRQRWIIVFSPDAHARACKTVAKQWKKDLEADRKHWTQLTKKTFASVEEAEAAFEVWQKKLLVTRVDSMRLISEPYYQGKGRPAKHRQPDGFTYRIDGERVEIIEKKEERTVRKSCFILATNHLDADLTDMDALSGRIAKENNPIDSTDDVLELHPLATAPLVIATYKGQQKVEKGFRFLKDPLFMATNLYLKSEERIMALMMVMCLCLLVYAALEYRVRQTLKETGELFPNQCGQPVSNPTARWIFQYFKGIHVLILNTLEEYILNLNEQQQLLLSLLGSRYIDLYSNFEVT
ncbi:MAG: IS1634 family transposase [Lamprobacter sp.]|uniref:IS1634 family transposase n=1 Tax=Lamprobacter sp. TaxID=3100796 RepID=UPI002B26205E|nr:IS1634 family transposase [Lamprobacter sp.]MEA3643709.1 IS1634 family transposase [Lamprobacter sp.]